MRTSLIVADNSGRRYLPHLSKLSNKISIQDLIPISSIETFNVSILIRFTPPNMAQGNAWHEIGSPEEEIQPGRGSGNGSEDDT
jgi:hypothetical protein